MAWRATVGVLTCTTALVLARAPLVAAPWPGDPTDLHLAHPCSFGLPSSAIVITPTALLFDGRVVERLHGGDEPDLDIAVRPVLHDRIAVEDAIARSTRAGTRESLVVYVIAAPTIPARTVYAVMRACAAEGSGTVRLLVFRER